MPGELGQPAGPPPSGPDPQVAPAAAPAAPGPVAEPAPDPSFEHLPPPPQSFVSEAPFVAPSAPPSDLMSGAGPPPPTPADTVLPDPAPTAAAVPAAVAATGLARAGAQTLPPRAEGMAGPVANSPRFRDPMVELGEMPKTPWHQPPRRAKPRRFHYHSLSNGLIVTLVIAGPVLLIEANWHGSPITRQPGGAWELAFLTVAAAFFLGGAVAGRHRRKTDGAFFQGLAVAVLAIGALAVASLVRRVVLRHGIPSVPTVGWIILATAVAIAISCAGALCGRALFIRSKVKRRR